MQFKELWDQYAEGIMVAFIAFLSFLALNYMDGRIFFIKSRIGEELAYSIYFFVGLLLSLFVAWVFQKYYISPKLKIAPVRDVYSRYVTEPVAGFRHYAMLSVEIPSHWTITDCFVTLDKCVPIYSHDKVLLDEKFSLWYSEQIAPEYKLLAWKSPYPGNDCKITIGDNSNKEYLFIGQITLGSAKDRYMQDVDIRQFEFSLCSNKPTTIYTKPLGLYEISLTLNWKLKDKKMIPKRFNGYIYSEIETHTPIMIVGSGNFREDKRIPEPLLKKVEEENEKSKTTKNRKTRRRKKG